MDGVDGGGERGSSRGRRQASGAAASRAPCEAVPQSMLYEAR